MPDRTYPNEVARCGNWLVEYFPYQEYPSGPYPEIQVSHYCELGCRDDGWWRMVDNTTLRCVGCDRKAPEKIQVTVALMRM